MLLWYIAGVPGEAIRTIVATCTLLTYVYCLHDRYRGLLVAAKKQTPGWSSVQRVYVCNIENVEGVAYIYIHMYAWRNWAGRPEDRESCSVSVDRYTSASRDTMCKALQALASFPQVLRGAGLARIAVQKNARLCYARMRVKHVPVLRSLRRRRPLDAKGWKAGFGIALCVAGDRENGFAEGGRDVCGEINRRRKGLVWEDGQKE